MEVLFVLIVLGGGAYWFFRGNIRRGAEIMRANVFLTALERGHSVIEANGYASREMSDLPPKFVHLANARASHQYNGMRLAMVGDAYRQGMHSKLPFWERSPIVSAFGGSGQTQTADVAQSDAPQPNADVDAPHWVRPFVLCYLMEELSFGGGSQTVDALLTGRLSGPIQSSLMGSLVGYMDYAYSGIDQYNIEPVVQDAQIFLKGEILKLKDPVEVRKTLKGLDRNLGAKEPTEIQLDQLVAAVQADLDKEIDTEKNIRDAVLKSVIEESFEKLHGQAFSQFLEAMVSFSQSRQAAH
jgi:hypothetical protein